VAGAAVVAVVLLVVGVDEALLGREKARRARTARKSRLFQAQERARIVVDADGGDIGRERLEALQDDVAVLNAVDILECDRAYGLIIA
jgi:hypothetical protein